MSTRFEFDCADGKITLTRSGLTELLDLMGAVAIRRLSIEVDAEVDVAAPVAAPEPPPDPEGEGPRCVGCNYPLSFCERLNRDQRKCCPDCRHPEPGAAPGPIYHYYRNGVAVPLEYLRPQCPVCRSVDCPVSHD